MKDINGFCHVMLVVLGLAVPVSPMSAETHDYSSYVKLVKNITITNMPPSEDCWDPAGAMNDDDSYLIPAGYTITSERNNKTTDHMALPGKEIAIAGTWNAHIWNNRSPFFVKTPRLALLPGGKITSLAGYATVIGDTLDIRGTADAPSLIDFTYVRGTDDNKKSWYYFLFDIAFTGGRDSVVKFMRSSGDGQDFHRRYQVTGGFADFFGTIVLDGENVWMWSAAPGPFDIPGTIELRSGANFYVYNLNPVFGSLKLGEGATLKIASGKYVTVTNSLVLSASSRIIMDGLPGNVVYDGSDLPEIPVLSVKGEALASEIDEAELLSAIIRGSHTLDEKSFLAGIPRLSLVKRCREDGGVDFFVTHDRVVRLIKSCLHNTGPFGNGDYEDYKDYMSDGTEVTKEEDFVNNGLSVLFKSDIKNYTFPGRSYTHTGGYLGFYSGQGMYVEDMRIVGTTSFIRQMVANMNAYLYGNLDVIGEAEFRVSGNKKFALHSNLSGRGDVVVSLDVAKIKEKGSAWQGTLELNGDNSAFSGRFLVGCGAATENVGQTNLTLRVSDGTHLGGDLDVFTYDSLKISKACTLAVTDNATYDAENRGWCLRDGASVDIADGKTVTVCETVTFGGASEKKGLGSLVLCGGVKFYDAENDVAADAPNGASFRIAKGALGVTSADALTGVGVIFAEGAKLLAFTGSPGMTLSSAPVFEGGILDVEIVKRPEDVNEPVNLFRLPAQVEFDASKICIQHVPGFKVSEVRSRTEDEDVVYYSILVKPGLSISIR